MRKVLFSAVVGFLFLCAWGPGVLAEDQVVRIARWYGNKEAAVSLRFDDNLESHVRAVIPMLNEFGIPGTFMVNPGKASFVRNKEFWTRQVPAMGHVLGNHTMNHKGAQTVEEARFEIGEAARFIRELYPERGPLMVFASGGGEKWGGNDWEEADPAFKGLVKEYDLIDLYDGRHPAFTAVSKTNVRALKQKVDQAIGSRTHQPFSFHHIGSPGWKDRLMSLLGGYDYSLSERKFREFLEYLSSRGDRLWMAPLVDILKYEEERDASRVTLLSSSQGEIVLHLEVATDPELYDHPLTIVLDNPGKKNFSADQHARTIEVEYDRAGNVILNPRPFDSEILLKVIH